MYLTQRLTNTIAESSSIQALRHQKIKKSLSPDDKRHYGEQLPNVLPITANLNQSGEPTVMDVGFPISQRTQLSQLLVNDCIMIFLQDICSDDGDDGERRGSFMVSRRTLLIAFTQRDCFGASSFRRGLSKDVDTMNA